MQNPYSYHYNEQTASYQFTTKFNILYDVVFIVYETLNSISNSIQFNHVYQIIIDKRTNKKAPLDNQVSLTIDIILRDFFKNTSNALIYICSQDNAKERQRFNTFNRWYNKSSYNNIITKTDNIILLEEPNSTIYTSILYHIDNPQAKNIIETFNTIEQILNDEK